MMETKTLKKNNLKGYALIIFLITLISLYIVSIFVKSPSPSRVVNPVPRVQRAITLDDGVNVDGYQHTTLSNEYVKLASYPIKSTNKHYMYNNQYYNYGGSLNYPDVNYVASSDYYQSSTATTRGVYVNELFISNSNYLNKGYAFARLYVSVSYSISSTNNYTYVISQCDTLTNINNDAQENHIVLSNKGITYYTQFSLEQLSSDNLMVIRNVIYNYGSLTATTTFQYSLVLYYGDNAIYDQGYQVGLQAGKGQVQSYPNDYNLYTEQEYNDSYDEGYNQGILDGADDYSFYGLFRSVVQAPITFIDSAFNVELFGLNLATAIKTIITLAVIGIATTIVFKVIF